MEEASKSLASFRASRPEDTLAGELSHHPQHCLNFCREPKTQHPCRDRRADPSLHASISSCSCSCMIIPVSSWRQSWNGSRALTQSLKPPGHFHLQNYQSDNSPAIYNFEFLSWVITVGQRLKGPKFSGHSLSPALVKRQSLRAGLLPLLPPVPAPHLDLLWDEIR